MILRRFRTKELHERPCCPDSWRDGMTDILGFFAYHSNVYRPSLPILRKTLERVGKNRLVDVCSGSGAYMLKILDYLNSEGEDEGCRAYLTDRFPNKDSLHRMAELSDGRITYRSEPLTALEAAEELSGLIVMFSALHHFDEPELKELAERAARAGNAIAFFDYASRNVLEFALPLLVSPLMVWSLTPLMWPPTWKRLLLTYVFPVIPLLVAVDGVVSHLRSYTVRELESIVDSLDVPGYHWEVGRDRSIHKLCPVTYLIGYPESEAGK